MSRPWRVSHRCDPAARRLADRHYNRQSIGAPNFVPPGRCLVLYGESDEGKAFWVTSWPFSQYVKHAWGGAWICSAFRNEGLGLSSELIVSAVAATRWRWPDVPSLGMITFVDSSKVRSTNPGSCYRHAGFTRLNERTKGGLIVLQMRPEDMPEAAMPRLAQRRLFG